MSYSAQQIDKGELRKYVTSGEKKEAKKQHSRKLRKMSKNINNSNPQYNRYHGGWIV